MSNRTRIGIVSGGTLVLVALAVLAGKALMPESTLVERLPAALGEPIAIAQEPEPQPQWPNFLEVTDSCGKNYDGGCVSVRSAPTTTAERVMKLRTGVVLPIATTTIRDATGREWLKVSFREWIRYPERVSGTWYVASDTVRTFHDVGIQAIASDTPPEPTNKKIVVDRSEQHLYAYEGDELVMESDVSTGLELTPTPRGTFTIYRKTPSRYMQGPLPGISDQYYDLPGVPWNLYFTQEGGAIHGAYWHSNFGQPWSHGCVNVPLDFAEKIYNWAPLGTKVVVHD